MDNSSLPQNTHQKGEQWLRYTERKFPLSIIGSLI